MNLGCGNAEFSEDMYDDGYKNIINIDIASNVIDQMKARNKSRKNMTFEVMDVRDMKFEDNSFDLIIDKSTIDALLCGENSYINVAKMLKETQRVLKDDGYYMIISYGKPENRVNHLERAHLDFEVSIYTIKKDFEDEKDLNKVHYVYLCKKLPNANDKSDKNFDFVIYQLEQQEMMENSLNNDAEDNEDDDFDDLNNYEIPFDNDDLEIENYEYYDKYLNIENKSPEPNLNSNIISNSKFTENKLTKTISSDKDYKDIKDKLKDKSKDKTKMDTLPIINNKIKK